MAQWQCQVRHCQNLLPYDDGGKYRLRYLTEEQVLALPGELQKVYLDLRGKNLCKRCAGLAQEAGLRVITVAQAKEWRRKKATNQLLDLISDDEAKKLEALKDNLDS